MRTAVPPNRPRRRTGRLTLVAIAALSIAAIVTGAGPASNRAATIDWSDPTVTVAYSGGWTAAVCGPEVPMVCVERHGEPVGLVEVGAAPLSAFADYDFDPDRPRQFLRSLVADFMADTIDQRLSVCGADYEVHPEPTRNRKVLGERGISFGFNGNFAGQETSELIIIHMAVVDDHVIFIGASAHDPTACEGGEEVFTVVELEKFRRHLPRLARHLPTPEFVFVP